MSRQRRPHHTRTARKQKNTTAKVTSGASAAVAQPRRTRAARKKKNTTAKVTSGASAAVAQQQPNTTVNITSSSALEDFFAQYSNFSYNPSESASREFYRLCNFNNWDREDTERADAHEAFKTALVIQFNHIYGTDEHSLSAWRDLCEVIGVSPIPDGLAACRKAVRGSHVNIVDLVDAKGTRDAVTRFGSTRELSEYTKLTGKFFPKENAYAGGLLKYLLRKIFSARGT